MTLETNFTGGNEREVFDAFISYSHEDERLARRLSRRIRFYRPPAKLQVATRKLSVFRDVERFTASHDLAGALAERVTASRKLVLLCSPGAAKSPYVGQEVRRFAEVKGSEAIIVALCRGTPAEVIPKFDGESDHEPLYIDLRPRQHGLWSIGHFRSESLRIIAALLGVDYSELRREDEKRHSRRRNGLIASAIGAAALISSAFLIRSVPEEAWDTVDLPTRHSASPLMPVQEYGVYRRDPSILFFRGLDANYQSQKPKRPIGLVARSLDFNEKLFSELALRDLMRREGRLEPGAVMRFSIDDPAGSRVAQGEMDVYAFLHLGTNQIRYIRTLRVSREVQAPPGGKRFELPATSDTEAANPFELDPWPLDPLTREELLPVGGYLRGSIRNRLERRESKVEYEIVNLQESFMEANDGMWFREKVISNIPEGTVQLGGNAETLSDIEPDWEEVASYPEVAAYRPPVVLKAEGPETLRTNQPARSLAERLGDKGLADVLTPLFVDDSDRSSTAIVVRRQDANLTFAAATLITRTYNEIAHLLQQTKFTYFLRTPGRPEWRTVNIPQGDGEIVDLIPLETTGRQLIVVTDTAGLLRTENGGESWSGFNLGEDRLIAGRNIRIITAHPAIYALLDNYAANPRAGNVLFHHHRRGSLERLRIALIAMLNRPGSTPGRAPKGTTGATNQPGRSRPK